MGIDYYPCGFCNETFPDCGIYGHCKCEDMLCQYCWEKFRKKYGEEKNDDYGIVSLQCDTCSLEKPSDSDLLGYALWKFGSNREDLENGIRQDVFSGVYQLYKRRLE